MDTMIALITHPLVAAAVMAAGAAIAIHGMRLETRGWTMAPRAAGKTVTFLRGIRLLIAGISVFGLGAALMWQQTWLAVLSLIFLGEEMWETSLALYGLRGGRHLRLHR